MDRKMSAIPQTNRPVGATLCGCPERTGLNDSARAKAAARLCGRPVGATLCGCPERTGSNDSTRAKAGECPYGNEKGNLLIQMLVAVVLLAIIGTAVLTAVAASSQSVRISDEKDTARNLAVSQMEYIKGLSWQTSYTPAPVPVEYTDAGYSVKVPISVETITQRDSNIQKIEITIVRCNKDLVTLQGYKVY